MRRNTPSYVAEIARELRRKPIEAETLLWEALRGRRMDGYRFYRQRPIVRYIPDFYCHELRLVIELDGEVHDNPEQHSYDTERIEFFKSMGIRTLRFRNEQVLNTIDEVLLQIRSVIANKEKPD